MAQHALFYLSENNSSIILCMRGKQHSRAVSEAAIHANLLRSRAARLLKVSTGACTGVRAGTECAGCGGVLGPGGQAGSACGALFAHLRRFLHGGELVDKCIVYQNRTCSCCVNYLGRRGISKLYLRHTLQFDVLAVQRYV